MAIKEVVVRNTCNNLLAELMICRNEERGVGSGAWKLQENRNLSCLGDRVLNGQSEGHRASKTGEPEHVLVVQGDPGLPAQVEQGAERVDIRCAGNQDCEESTEDEPKVEFVVTEGEH